MKLSSAPYRLFLTFFISFLFALGSVIYANAQADPELEPISGFIRCEEYCQDQPCAGTHLPYCGISVECCAWNHFDFDTQTCDEGEGHDTHCAGFPQVD